MTLITDIPIDDILPIIFRNLLIKDLLTCRLVNKLFKYFSDHTNGINELIIGESNLRNDYYWIYNNELVENKEIISLKCFRAIQKLSIFNLDKYLKYLKIYDSQFKLEEISNLINLESLEFGRYSSYSNQQIINLNNLKVFVSNNYFVELNTPKIEKIKFRDINKIRLNNNPNLIKHLITIDYNNKLENFKNLEIMELRNVDQPVNENLLIIFKNLKQLKINLNFEIVSYLDERFKNCLIKILNDKIKLKKQTDIYLEGIKILNINKFNELANEYPYWKFIINNYDLLDSSLPFVKYLNYHDLEQCVTNIKNLPTSFFDKFFSINQVYVDSVKDVDGLNWFLSNLKYLRQLTINEHVSLGQLFYNNLPNTIRYLDINEDINCNFILKFTKLIDFYTCKDKNLFDLALKSFSNLKNLIFFAFHFDDNEILIKKNSKGFYLNDELMLDYNQLVKECNKIRLK